MKALKTIPAVLMIIASACNTSEGGYGTVSFTADSGFEVTDATKSSLSDYTDAVPDAEEFSLLIKDSDNNTIFEGPVKDWDETDPLFSGSYTASLSFGKQGEEGKDRPYLYGEKQFEIKSGKNTSVALRASLQNSIVSVSLGEMFKRYYSDINIALETGSGNNLELKEGNPVFIEAFRFDVSGTMKTPQGKDVRFTKRYETSDIKPATRYLVRIEAEGLGSASINITFNNEVAVVDLGEITIND